MSKQPTDKGTTMAETKEMTVREKKELAAKEEKTVAEYNCPIASEPACVRDQSVVEHLELASPETSVPLNNEGF